MKKDLQESTCLIQLIYAWENDPSGRIRSRNSKKKLPLRPLKRVPRRKIEPYDVPVDTQDRPRYIESQDEYDRPRCIESEDEYEYEYE